MRLVKYTYEEFRDILWSDYISEKVVSTAYMNRNEKFINSLAFDAYRMYLQSGVDVKIFAKMIESFFFSLFKFKGENMNIEDNSWELD